MGTGSRHVLHTTASCDEGIMKQGELSSPTYYIVEFSCDPTAAHSFLSLKFTLPVMPNLLFPVECPFFPRIDESHKQNENVNEHQNDTGRSDFLENERPGEEENNFDVKQKE